MSKKSWLDFNDLDKKQQNLIIDFILYALLDFEEFDKQSIEEFAKGQPTLKGIEKLLENMGFM